MKKFIFLVMLASATFTALAQNAVVKGKFYKLLPNGKEVDRVFLSKSEDGDLKLESEVLKARHDQMFRADLAASDQNTIRYIGVFDEQYPVFMRPGEELTIDAGDGKIVYSGDVNKENKVFADWYKLIQPIRKFGYTKKGYTLPPQEYVMLLDSLWIPVQEFVKNIKTGNDSFDKQVKYLLPYSFKFDLLVPFSTGFSLGRKNEYPAKLVNLFNDEKFSDRNIWTLPFGYKYMQYLGFAKHIIYNSEMGLTGEILIPEISDKELRAQFILSEVEKGVTQDLSSFLAKNSQYMVTDQQKSKMKVFEQRARLKIPGTSWIDFSYPDINGKIHNLSDYLGNVVLIDVWATWCAPCLAEQPGLEELEKSFKGKKVVFISLSIDTDKAKWKDMVEKKKLSGLHLFSNHEGPIIADYEVTSIPRFILFDKNGKTVDLDAPRPSDVKLKTLIQSKL